MSTGPVAVIDIGSNTIKLLVAVRAADGSVLPLDTAARDARIGKGISRAQPRLSPEGMAAGIAAVRELVEVAARFGPETTLLVATSAVRDAQNGAEFCEQIRAATGLSVRVLSGDEEAALIGRGLTVDPALRDHRDFYVFDLGGGSLECLVFRGRRIEEAVSLPLGCVRLTEKFGPKPDMPFNAEHAADIAAHTRRLLAESRFKCVLGAGALAVGTGGTMMTTRAILAARSGRSLEATSPRIELAALRDLLAWVGPLALPERKKVPGLPAARADVYPTALATIITVAEVGAITAYHTSVYNLRYGVADNALAATQ